ncbi:Gfo/Idh/MocA family protein [Bacillus massiliigorillae]|uniref:Gfo/Idh/MocA family protein n=1 Tax=Bacillus massiliigorillae TaxID=1243664 RepID=UPI00039AA337|nr:Gfo/Idh/MocA family oxidoreductase [Bacillus massiliigorillae]
MIKFGIIGTNWITERFINAAKQVEGFSLTAVYSRTEERANDFASQFNIPYTYTSIEDMVQSDTIDAVYIASPNSLHAEQAILCMNHGKHVLCEKPLASNVVEIQAMVAAAKQNQVLLMEALKTTFIPNFTIIKEHLHKIGPVRRYFANFCQYSSRYDAYKGGTVLNAFNPTFSNGSLMDIGVYCLYPLVTLFGEPMKVQANGLMLESGVDGQGSITLQYKDMEAIIMYSKISESQLPNEIQGELGRIVINKISSPSQVQIVYNDGTVEDITQPQLENTMFYEVQEFIDLLHKQQLESTINTYENSFITMKIMDEARKQIGVTYPADQK